MIAALGTHYQYDPFGRTIESTGTYKNTNKFRFSTKYFEDDWGLSYYGYRWYHPDTGRWLSRDPLGQRGSVNLYGFVYSDPITVVDPLGLQGHSHTHVATTKRTCRTSIIVGHYTSAGVQHALNYWRGRTTPAPCGLRVGVLSCLADEFNVEIAQEEHPELLIEGMPSISQTILSLRIYKKLLETLEAARTEMADQCKECCDEVRIKVFCVDKDTRDEIANQTPAKGWVLQGHKEGESLCDYDHTTSCKEVRAIQEGKAAARQAQK